MRRSLLLNLGILALGAVAVSSVRADRITKRDGTSIEGTAKQVDGGYEVTGANGLKRFVPAADIKSIKIDNTGKLDEATARERFESLRRSSENERDVNRAVERYEALVPLVEGTTAAADVKKELAVWVDRRDRKMSRVGKNWLTPADQDALLSEIAQRVDSIRVSIASGDFDGASAQLRSAASLDPNNISFNYLAGVMQYRRGQFNEAKRSFDVVAEQAPDHAPTLVNQAALLVKFKRWPQAANALDAAMVAAPGNPDVLDAVTEFIQLLPEGSRKSTVVDRLMKRYGVQEANLEEQMAAERKLFRWGSQWVDGPKLAELKKQRDAVAQKKREMEEDFTKANERIRTIDEDLRRTQNMIDGMERSQFVRDDTGRVYRRELPQAYWDYKRDLDVLNGRRREEVAKVDELKKKAAEVEKSSPAAPYRGVVEPIGEVGVPVILPASATQPTAPAVDSESIAPMPEAAPSTRPTGGQAFIPYRPGAAATQRALE